MENRIVRRIAPSTAACVFPGGVIPARVIDPASAKLLKYLPAPNAPGNLFSTVGLGNQNLHDDKLGQHVDINTQRAGNWFIYYFSTNPQ